MQINIKNIEELKNFIQNLLNKGYSKFLLKWDLWAGKTEFTKQLANLIGIKNITSPTYTYINIYENKLLHWDFYRINSEAEFLNLWILDEIDNYPFICIEWPKFEKYYADPNYLVVEIKKNPDQSRLIKYFPYKN